MVIRTVPDQVAQPHERIEAGFGGAQVCGLDGQIAQRSEDGGVEGVLHAVQPTEPVARREHETGGEVRGEGTVEVLR